MIWESSCGWSFTSTSGNQKPHGWCHIRRDSIQRSIYASIGGLLLVMIFLVVYYRLPGLIADLALLIYALLTWASFALLSLTLPGCFYFSIGMAVDANVLILSERGKNCKQANLFIVL